MLNVLPKIRNYDILVIIVTINLVLNHIIYFVLLLGIYNIKLVSVNFFQIFNSAEQWWMRIVNKYVCRVWIKVTQILN